MSKQDIRWEQRFSNFVKAFDKLQQAVKYIEHNFLDDDNPEERENLGVILNDLIKQGLIQSFEYTHELAWNVMKDFLDERGTIKMYGSKDATRLAFSTGLITNGEVWMEMIVSRNKTSHTYNEETADEIFKKIMEDYSAAFLAFRETMENKRSGTQGTIFEL